MSGKLKVIITILVTGIVVSAVWGFFWHKDKEKIVTKWQNEVAQLTATLDALGPAVDCYTVSEEYYASHGNDVTGQTITQDSLTVIQVPQSVVGDAFIQNSSDIINKYFRINLEPGTPITKELVMEEIYDDTLRDVDLVADAWNVGMRIGDYIDVRILFPQGQGYTVLSHKRIQSVGDSTFKVYITEEEMATYEGAAVDRAMCQAIGGSSRLSLVKYVDPGLQPAALPTYAVPTLVLDLMKRNPNITTAATSTGNSLERTNIENLFASLQPENYTLQQYLTADRSIKEAWSSSIKQDYNSMKTDENNNGGQGYGYGGISYDEEGNQVDGEGNIISPETDAVPLEVETEPAVPDVTQPAVVEPETLPPGETAVEDGGGDSVG